MPNFSFYIIGFFVIAIISYIFILNLENKELKNKLIISQQKIDSYQKNLDAAYSAISTQNNAIQEMKDLADAQEIKLKSAINKSDLIQKNSQKQYQSILNTSISSKCDEALNWGIEEAKKVIKNP